MKEIVSICLWSLSAVAIMGLGVQLLLFQPAWERWFPNVWIAFFSAVVLPTLVLTLISGRWFFEDVEA